VTKHWNNYDVLLLGRILGGVATSLLFTAFESWLVSEHNKARTRTRSRPAPRGVRDRRRWRRAAQRAARVRRASSRAQPQPQSPAAAIRSPPPQNTHTR
jgi:hypothetical protein